MDLNLSDKTALVTGANRGTGQIIASALASEGTRVIVHSNQQPDDAQTDGVVFGDLATAEGCEQVLAQLQGRDVEVRYALGIATGDRRAPDAVALAPRLRGLMFRAHPCD